MIKTPNKVALEETCLNIIKKQIKSKVRTRKKRTKIRAEINKIEPENNRKDQ